MKAIYTILFIVFLLGCSDSQQNYYKNKDAIIKDNAIQRGWIPSIIPDSAYKIEEEHNLDTNILKGSFQYNEKDENIFLNKLEKSNEQFIWKDFVFTLDTENNKVEFRNK